MHHDAIEIDDRPHGIELSVAPHRHLHVEVGGDFGNQGRRHINTVEIVHDILNVPSGHTLGVEGKDLLIETVQAALVLWDQSGFEGTIAVAWRRDPNLAEIALYSFWGISVAAILPTRLRWRISRRFRSCRCRCVPRGTC